MWTRAVDGEERKKERRQSPCPAVSEGALPSIQTVLFCSPY